MPRKPRVFVAGAWYHVYCRIARGERPFASQDEVARLVEIISAVKDEHRLTILAWCVMPNHYHLVLRSGELPLWRSMRLVQGRYAKARNRRARVLGPVWQGRYKSRLIEGGDYLRQAIVYVHLNPVAGGLVSDPGRYRWSGHPELLGKASEGLVDVDETLLAFGSTRTRARRSYAGAMRRGPEAAWFAEGPGHLPWWHRRSRESEELEPASDRPRLDALGATAAPMRPRMDAGTLVAAVAASLDLACEALGGRGQTGALTRARQLAMLIGVEICSLRVKELAERIGRNPGTASRLYSEAAARRRDDAAFRALVEKTVAALTASHRTTNTEMEAGVSQR